MTSVTIPNSVTSIGTYAFSGCSGVKTIFYNAENCANVNASSYIFADIYKRINIIIGKDVKNIPNYLFYSLSNAPSRVISQSVTPPTCGANSFNSKVYKANLYVPSEAYAKYWAADVWSNFSNLKSISNPITEIKLDQATLNLWVGSTVKLNATKTPSNPTIDLLYWSSDSPAATVDQDGNVKGMCFGTATITAEALDGSGVKATCRVSVMNYIATSIYLTPGELKLDINQTGTTLHLRSCAGIKRCPPQLRAEGTPLATPHPGLSLRHRRQPHFLVGHRARRLAGRGHTFCELWAGAGRKNAKK